MKSSQDFRGNSGKFTSMKTRHLAPALLGIALVVLLLTTGCHALSRGDFLKAADDAVIFRTVSFLMADNPALTRDCVTTVNSSDYDITITVPYGADMVSGLNFSFEVVARDARVGTWVGPGDADIAEWTSGTQLLTFADAFASRSVRIVKTDPKTGEVKFRDYAIRVNKILRPKLLNPNNPAVVWPVPLRVAIVDEDDNPIPAADATAGTFDPGTFPPVYDNYRFDIDPATFPVTYQPAVVGPPAFPEGFEVFVNPYFPNEHEIFLPEGIFQDALGYATIGSDTHPWDPGIKGTNITFSYDPPAMHLAYWGDDANAGTDPAAPVRSWTTAVTNAQAFGVFDIYIAASQNQSTDVYDVAGEGQFDGTALNPYFNVYGGWRSDFSSRYQDSGLDTDQYPPTILFDSTQVDGTSAPFSPSAVFIYDNPAPFNLVLDDVYLVVSPQPTPPTLNVSTSLWLRNGANLTINRVHCNAFQGDGLEAMAFTMTTGAVAKVRDSHFVGRNGGSTDSATMFLANFDLYMESSAVIAGDLSAGDSVGIFANDGNLTINLAWILAGFNNPGSDPNAENNVIGILANGVSSALNRVWVHTGRAVNNSIAFENRASLVGRPSNIVNSAFLSGRADNSIGITMLDFGTSPELHMFNSVVDTGIGNGFSSSGLRLQNLQNSQIMGNAIRVNNLQGSSPSYGIEVQASAGPFLDIRNNLIFSTTVDDLVGIYGFNDITNYTIRNNDFWDNDDKVELELTPGLLQPLYDWHLAYAPLIYGNINETVSVDMGYSYSTEEFSIGRIQGTPPTDVMMGGEDLSDAGANILEYPEEFGPWDKRDRVWNQRTGYSGLGWTMGPYEIDSGSLPTAVYVAEPANGGDDGNPLGTAAHPFASLNRAYDAIRNSAAPIAYQARWDVTQIRVRSGTYDMPNLIVDNGWNLLMTGGYGGGTSVLRSADVSVVDFMNFQVDPTRFENFSVENISAGALSYGIRMMNGTNAELRYNTIRGGTTSTSWAVYCDNGAEGLLAHGDIDGGGAAGGNSYAIGVDNGSWTNIVNNDILGGNGGNTTTGIWVGTSWPSLELNRVNGGNAVNVSTGIFVNDGGGLSMIDNTVNGGSANNATIGIQVIGDWISIRDNTVYGGDAAPGTGISTGIDLNATPSELLNNTFEGGTGLMTRGAYIMNASVYAQSNRFDGGTAVSDSTGARIDGSAGLRMEGNEILGGQSPVTRGMAAINAGSKVFVGNRIFGGESTGDSYGVDLFNANDTTLINNLVHGGNTGPGSAYGVYINNGAALVTLLNNTVYSGWSSGPASAAVEFFNGAQPILENNILIAGDAALPTNARGVNQIGAGIPTSFLNNFILSTQDQAIPYRADLVDCLDAPAIDDVIVDGVPGPPVDLTFVNVADPASIYFNLFRANSGESEFLSDNWDLQGGTPGSPLSYGIDQSMIFGVYGVPSVDYLGNLRSIPWSVGAYE